MRIRAVRVQNFRGFEDETVSFGSCTCLVGPNGAGKSTILSALNVFFQEASSATDVATLTTEDFHGGNTDVPIQITVTFDQLSEAAKEALSHYVRHGELVITSVAVFDPQTAKAPVIQWGERLVFKQFAPFFEDDKNKTTVEPLRARFFEITKGLADFPDIGKKPAKAAMIDALRSYEEARPEICETQRSSDHFYGVGKIKGKLEPFVQWIYLPAVKDASAEAEEAGNTALGKLLQRTVRQKVNFDDALEALRTRVRAEYDALLEAEQGTLQEISDSLAKRLAVFAHPDASLMVEWLQGSEKSVSIGEPRATIKAREGLFKGSILRFGHGLQRSFLLAILQELASVESASTAQDGHEKPTLVLGCEEPELYQHPPQAKHLSTVLRELASLGNQVMLTTHSPYFVSGEEFDEIRLVRRAAKSGESNVKSTDFDRFALRIAKATGRKPDKNPVARAKLLAALRPEPSELYFSQRLVLVEGIADRAYLSAALHLDGQWNAMRRAGLHILPTEGKSNILQLLTIAQELEIPAFVIFDADGDETRPGPRRHHEIDNTALLTALQLGCGAFPPEIVWDDCCAIWPNNIEDSVRLCFDGADWDRINNEARRAIDPSAGGLGKNPALIGELLAVAWAEGKRPDVLVELMRRLNAFGDQKEAAA
ncbi:AAA family ATPase [Bradyrhizobium sp. BR 1432]|uniref:AAA family ATPase n=1 Tax=Bradyrhizobium sp. BR 1432 TaxID=3447966 RepID=UPI003EE7A338